MLITDVEELFNNPLKQGSVYSDEELADLSLYVTLTSEQFKHKGYFVDANTWRELDFPARSVFAMNAEGDKDLLATYKEFAWRGFLKYCQPCISDDNVLTGFAYKGNFPLDNELVEYMMRFPPVDWINAVLLSGNISMSDELRSIIESNKTAWNRDICAEFKQEQSRLYALLYLLDCLPFVVRSFDKDFRHTIECYTRSPIVLKQLVPDVADIFIETLNGDEDFDTPISGIIRCVKLVGVQESGTTVKYTASLEDIDTRMPFRQMLPYFQFKAFTDGFSQRINDTPGCAAMLSVDLQKSGITRRYATLNKQVLKSMYANTSMLTVSTRSKFKCGLDIVDFSFKYWNLQSSIHSDRSWSGFSPFSLRGIQRFNSAELSKGILDADYALVYKTFQAAIFAHSDNLKPLAVACGIAPTRPALKNLLLDKLAKSHPSELFKIMSKNKELFNI